MEIVKRLEEVEELYRESARVCRAESDEATAATVKAMRFGQSESFRIAADWLHAQIEQIRKELAQ